MPEEPEQHTVEIKSPNSTAKHKKHYVGNYEIKRTLGEGSFAKVKLAIHKLTGQNVAIKCIDKDHLPDEYSVRNMHREAQIMRLLDHPNVIQLYEVMETKKEIFLVIEYAAGGEILDYIVAHGRIKEPEAKKFVAQIVDALTYCHSTGVVHRDLKAENLLLDGDLNIKITDFGLSNVYDKAKKLSTFCGSPVYSAPELIEGIEYTGPEVDCWSLGINIFAIVVGELPFAEKNVSALYEAILKCRYEMPTFLSEECQDLIRRLLVLNPKKRYTIAQVKAHPWLQNSGVATVNYEEERTKPKDEKDIDLDILGQLVVMGFEKEAAIKAILEGRYNQVSATYFLFKRKKIADLKLAKKNGDSNNSIDTKESTITTVKEDEELKTRPRGASISTPPSTEPPKSTDGPAAAPKPPVVTAPVARPRIQSAGAPRPAAVTVGHKHSPLANPGNVVDQEAGSTPEQAPKTTLLGEAPKATPQPAGIKSPPAAREKKLRPRAFSIGTATGGESTKNKPLEIKKVESRDDTSTTSGSTNFGSQALDADGIRTVRFAFNCSTTSSAPPTVMLEKIKEALETEKVKFNIELFLFSCVYYRDGDTTTTPINFEVEVCKIPRLAMHGIRFRRLSGEIWEYKRLCTRLIKDWESLKS